MVHNFLQRERAERKMKLREVAAAFGSSTWTISQLERDNIYDLVIHSSKGRELMLYYGYEIIVRLPADGENKQRQIIKLTREDYLRETNRHAEIVEEKDDNTLFSTLTEKQVNTEDLDRAIENHPLIKKLAEGVNFLVQELT